MNPWLLRLPPSPLALLLLLSLVLSSSPPPSFVSGIDDGSNPYTQCSQPTVVTCGNSKLNVSYPFIYQPARQEYCGYPGFDLTCVEEQSMLTIKINSDLQFAVTNIDYSNQLLTVVNPNYFMSPSCAAPPPSKNITLNGSIFNYLDDNFIYLFMNCSSPVPGLPSVPCAKDYSYYLFDNQSLPLGLGSCTPLEFWANQTALGMLMDGAIDFWKFLQQGLTLRWTAGSGCGKCMGSGGTCGFNFTTEEESCFTSASAGDGVKADNGKANVGRNVGIGVGAGVAFLLLASFLFLCYNRRKRIRRSSPPILVVRTSSSTPSYKSKTDSELGISRYRTHVFTYVELEEATDGFSPSEELGDGGFGTVYKGTLRDGRVVAVKRLYENNYKRVEQFMNEVDILSGLQHQNLVTLYGCTSRHSRELLLVYEYVPNGTVADHLHGSRATERGLPWSIRISIAIETADALRYLHAVEPQIIHRDVKTNNILLDNSFHVKVADFGLSRLFPLNATHVSTAPQGTPGYVDPEYHQCYQLTDKSDVYSFGVVLAELISSMPAVDVGRQRSEINLANMMINKMQNNILHHVVDPRLGYQTDSQVKKMIDMVAELAFRCLQAEREMRPSIKQVLDALREIESGGFKTEEGEHCIKADDTGRQDTYLLKNQPPYSPNSVTQRWASLSSTPNTSG